MTERFGAQIEWRPFDLHPEYPPEGVPRGEVSPQMVETFAANGLAWNPPPVRPNSMGALRLAEHARGQGRFDAMHRRLMDAYWAEAQDIGSKDVLRALAADAGVEDADEVLETDAYLDAVRGSTREAQLLGVTGVPAFVLAGRLLVLGAHPTETFERAFAQVAAT
jgi:predicted DsbA family dithiol-disulfide isomerase